MGAVIAIGSIVGLLFLKHHAAAAASSGSTAGPLTSSRITGAPDPSVSYDTKAPAQADPIGNTHLSILDPVYSSSGEIVGLPLRPSDVAYGGGIPDLVGVGLDDVNPAGSPGSGITAIEKINAPGASGGIPGGVGGRPRLSLPTIPIFRRSNIVYSGAPLKAGDTGSGKLPVVPPSSTGPITRHPVSPLRPTIAIAHPGFITASTQLAAAPNQPADAQPQPAGTAQTTPLVRSNRFLAGRFVA